MFSKEVESLNVLFPEVQVDGEVGRVKKDTDMHRQKKGTSRRK